MATPRKTPTKEQKQWMKENGYTEYQMDMFWNDCISTNFIIRNLSNSGHTWRDMTLSCVQQLPTQKERDLAIIAEREKKDKEEKDAAVAEEERKQYYKDHFDEIMIVKIDTGEELTEDELSKLIWDFQIETSEGENGRWTRTNTTIILLCGRYFSIEWEEGLTEYQDNQYLSQPVEVTLHTYEKTITVKEWVAIGKTPSET